LHAVALRFYLFISKSGFRSLAGAKFSLFQNLLTEWTVSDLSVWKAGESRENLIPTFMKAETEDPDPAIGRVYY